ncbi:BLUF domain-containing protein [Hymenobacter sp. BRD128]|uniref:BLUF domain-containing protein n=1 Tax=Hymenobacter sp. BRD128 TaxID=2675878 RepID=UPI0015671B97|nr:BLUF domain-containing protein [Hymenobacter sp. BRD128]QKG57691.1 BLUF domain-containing protein [Hymenobacter sp. BRD128]
MHQLDLKLVYVIEDNPITAATTKVLLEKALHEPEVQLYTNGQRALNQLVQTLEAKMTLPDLVLLDLNMPLMDGWEFLDAFASLPLTHPVCVLLLTSSINPEDRAKAARYQSVAGYFSKPLDARILSRILRLHWEANGPGHRAPIVPDNLHYLVYQSYATVPFGDLQLAKLLTQSRAFNASNGLTGLLLYSHGNIVQVLEGSKANVHAVFSRIVQDPRHTHIIKLADGAAPHRLFTQWSMGFRAMSPADFRHLTGYINPEQEDYLARSPGLPDTELHVLLTNFVDENDLSEAL